jgi:glycosyltransferase involved in cell wall biosynthesis
VGRPAEGDEGPVKTGNALHGISIVCVGFADWDSENWTNQQHLMSRLALENRVLFVESLGLRRPTLSRRDLRRMARRLRRSLHPLNLRDGVYVLSPLVVPFHGRAAVRRLNRFLLRRAVRVATARLGMERPILWGYVPQAIELVDLLAPIRVVYHCVDDIAAHERIDDTSFAEAERRFLERADLVIASSAPLAQRLAAGRHDVRLMPNVADTGLFATALEPGPIDSDLDALPRPRIVFVGAVSAIKLDLALIAELARLRPAWSIALVGPVGLGDPSTDVSALAQLPNVHLLGARTCNELPAVMRGADAGLIPYRLNRLTASIFPMKVYEYLAAGLGIVSTRLPSLAGVEDVRFAGDAAETAVALEALLAEDADDERRRRSQVASGHSWEARLREIAAALAEVP